MTIAWTPVAAGLPKVTTRVITWGHEKVLGVRVFDRYLGEATCTPGAAKPFSNEAVGWFTERKVTHFAMINEPRRSPSIPTGAFCLYRDVNQWCCVRGDFINLQESPAGFGATPAGAMMSLIRNEARQRAARQELQRAFRRFYDMKGDA